MAGQWAENVAQVQFYALGTALGKIFTRAQSLSRPKNFGTNQGSYSPPGLFFLPGRCLVRAGFRRPMTASLSRYVPHHPGSRGICSDSCTQRPANEVINIAKPHRFCPRNTHAVSPSYLPSHLPSAVARLGRAIQLGGAVLGLASPTVSGKTHQPGCDRVVGPTCTHGTHARKPRTGLDLP